MPPTVRNVRVFLSSPGDVAEERNKIRELLLGLSRGPYLRGRVNIEVVSWDDPLGSLDARITPQVAVDLGFPPPGQCDITIVLLWARMGTPLTHRKPDGTLYASGLEWEFENALAANKPVLIYRRADKVLLDADAPDFEDRLSQKRQVDAFFSRFVGADGTTERTFATYSDPEDLLRRVRQDIEQLLAGLLEAEADPRAKRNRQPVPKSRPKRSSHTARKVFLCYRRDDSGPIVGRIYDRLVHDFGETNIFKDVDDIPFGVDFVEHLDRAVEKCNVLFAVIGPRWLDMGHNDMPRLHDASDFVRIEIVSALRRSIPVVPILVDGALMPRADQLPDEIKELARRNGTAVRHDPDFHGDMARLLSRLG